VHAGKAPPDRSLNATVKGRCDKLCGVEAVANPAIAAPLRKAIAERKPYRDKA